MTDTRAPLPFPVEFTVTGGMLVKDGKWPHYLWSAVVRGNHVPYKTGVGLVRKDKTPIPPTAADVLHAVVMDASSVRDTNFADWCADLGYSFDSIEDLMTYRECCREAAWYRKAFDLGERVALDTYFQDY